MKQHYENVIKTLKEMTEGNKTIPNDESLDESLRLSLLDIYSSKEHKKLGNLVSLLANVYLKNGEFKENYAGAFEEAACDLYHDYENLNKYHLNKSEENMKSIREFYQDSIKKYCESN